MTWGEEREVAIATTRRVVALPEFYGCGPPRGNCHALSLSPHPEL